MMIKLHTCRACRTDLIQFPTNKQIRYIFLHRLVDKTLCCDKTISEKDLPAMLFRIDVPEYANNPCRKASAICETLGSSASKAFSNLATFSFFPIPNSTIPVMEMKQRTVIFVTVLIVWNKATFCTPRVFRSPKDHRIAKARHFFGSSGAGHPA